METSSQAVSEQFRVPIRGERSRKMLAAMQGREMSAGELALVADTSPDLAKKFLWRANRKGLVKNVARGKWTAASRAEEPKQAKVEQPVKRKIKRTRRGDVREKVLKYLRANGEAKAEELAALFPGSDPQILRHQLWEMTRRWHLIKRIGYGRYAPLRRSPGVAKAKRVAKPQEGSLVIVAGGKRYELAEAIRLHAELDAALSSLRKALK